MPTNILIEKGGKIVSIATGCDPNGVIASIVSEKAGQDRPATAVVNVQAKVRSEAAEEVIAEVCPAAWTESQQCTAKASHKRMCGAFFFFAALGGGERTAGIMAAGNEELPRRPVQKRVCACGKPRLAVATFGKDSCHR